MKTSAFKIPRFVFFLFVAVSAFAENLMTVDEVFNPEERTVIVFKAPQNEANKVMDWKLGNSPELITQQELFKVALKRANEEGIKRQLVIGDIVGMEWKRTLVGWRVTVHFRANKDLTGQSGRDIVKDDGVIISCDFLPSGVDITKTIRAMTDQELATFGLAASPPNQSIDPFGK